ncbi:hypothetical protein [Nannocystis sp.]|uniref:hypothetical protein n=1 Tax=Nannocystis sp. TaxID=1962667 RepID=UPI00242762A8|nr:hypothetical protein [Nannocystis sp.]MBK7823713.1 hypothetical protein [Nannocystis sp.]MBK9755765.1 hypothetical protein [Nannocystis sp.]
MRRRGFLGLVAALPLLTAAGGLELLKPRRARFEEVGDSVLMTVDLPELLLLRDADAMASLDSAFRTRLEYELSLYRAGQSDPVEQRRVTVYIQWDPWKERFVVETQEQGRSPTRRYFIDRDEAIVAAIRLDRVRLARASALDRGPKAVYFATVVGQRNPIEKGLLAPDEGEGDGRGQGRDLSVFSRWVGIFIRATQSAEKTVAIKTSPAFYLVPR